RGRPGRPRRRRAGRRGTGRGGDVSSRDSRSRRRAIRFSVTGRGAEHCHGFVTTGRPALSLAAAPRGVILNSIPPSLLRGLSMAHTRLAFLGTTLLLLAAGFGLAQQPKEKLYL